MSRSIVALVPVVLGVLLSGCGQDSVTAPPVVPPASPATILISGAPGLMVPGSEADLTATVLAPDGRPLLGAQVQWSTDRPDIAVVNASGVIHAGNIEGPVRIQAEAGGVVGSVETFVSKTALPGRLAMGQVSGPYTQTVWLVPLDGLPRTQVGTIQSYAYFVGGPDWSRDGARLLFVCTQPVVALCTLSLSGELTVVPNTNGLPHSYFRAVWGPADSEIVFTDRRAGASACYGDCLGAWAIRPDGSSLRFIPIPGTDAFTSAAGLQYSPDGKFADFRLLESIYDSYSLCVQPVPIDQPGACLEDANTSSWSPDGRRLAIQFGTSLVVREVDGSGQDVVVFSGSYPDDLALSPTWSPDGHWLAFQRMSAGKPATGSIWLVRPDGTNLLRLTGPGWVGPAWGR